MKSCRNVNVHAVLSQYIVEGTKELEKFKIEYVLVVFFRVRHWLIGMAGVTN
jgi:hypothetical protein